jgi:excisionase family DNA binding protein
MEQQGDALWTTEELSKRLSISVGTLKRWRREGTGPPFIRLGRQARYDPATVRAWLREQGRERRG